MNNNNNNDDHMFSLCVLLVIIVYYNSQRNRHKISRRALLAPSFSAWQRLYSSNDDNSFLDITGLTKSAFMILEKHLFVYNPLQNIGIGGRPSLLDNIGKLGLYLLYVNSTLEFSNCPFIYCFYSPCMEFNTFLLAVTLFLHFLLRGKFLLRSVNWV